jgi:hypothetical protein
MQSRERRRTMRPMRNDEEKRLTTGVSVFLEGESSAPGTRISISIKQPVGYRPDDAAGSSLP